MSYLVIIRGPLGVGKTTVAERVSDAIGAEHLSIDQILEEHRLEEWDEDRISLESFLAANRIASERALPRLKLGTSVVVDGNFYWRRAIDDLLERLDFPHFVFSLEAPLAVCIERDSRRPLPAEGNDPHAGEQMGEAATRQVYRMVTEVGYGIPVDATGPASSAASTILGHLPPRPSSGASG